MRHAENHGMLQKVPPLEKNVSTINSIKAFALTNICQNHFNTGITNIPVALCQSLLLISVFGAITCGVNVALNVIRIFMILHSAVTSRTPNGNVVNKARKF